MFINKNEKRRCCFAGHSNIYDNNLINKIIIQATYLIETHAVTEFWMGNYGDFDRYACEAINRLKKKYPYIHLELVLPYLTKEINKHQSFYKNKYDILLIADIPEKTPNKLKILKTNEYMIKNSDYLIAYITHSWGGASKTLEYAQRKKDIKIYNLAE